MNGSGRATGDAPAPAYYAHGSVGWQAWWTLLHPPYTMLHLAFVVIGAALAPTLHVDRLLWTLLAFFLAMGLAAHALDEIRDRPLRTRIPDRTLLGLAVLSLAAACAIGVWGAGHYALPGALWFVPVGVFLVVAYNLEWWNGRFHTDASFALAWGAFPALTAYYAQTGTLDLLAWAGAAMATALAATQRALSTPARTLRRRTKTVEGRVVDHDGLETPITRTTLLRTPEAGLRGLVWVGILLAAMLLVRHLV